MSLKLTSYPLGGNLGNFLISFMVLIEVPIHKYFSEPQNYNPVQVYYNKPPNRALVDVAPIVNICRNLNSNPDRPPIKGTLATALHGNDTLSPKP